MWFYRGILDFDSITVDTGATVRRCRRIVCLVSKLISIHLKMRFSTAFGQVENAIPAAAERMARQTAQPLLPVGQEATPRPLPHSLTTEHRIRMGRNCS